MFAANGQVAVVRTHKVESRDSLVIGFNPNGKILAKNSQIKFNLDTNSQSHYPIFINPPNSHPHNVPFLLNVTGTPQLPYTGKNNVAMWGWNIGAGGSNYIAGRPGIGFSLESNWHPGGELVTTYVESHEFYLRPDGKQIRLKSYNISVPPANEFIDLYHTADQFHIRDTLLSDYFSVGRNRVNNSSTLSLITPVSNHGINMVMQSTGLDVALTGFSSVSGKQINLLNCERIILPFINTSLTDNYVHVTGDIYNSNGKKNYGWALQSGSIGAFNKGYFSANPGAGLTGWVPRANIEIVANDTNAANLLLLIQKSNFSTNIFSIDNAGNIKAVVRTFADDAAAAADGTLPATTIYQVGNDLRIK